MNLKIRKILGLEKLHPDVQYFLDSENLNIAVPASFIVMVIEFSLFLNTIIYTIKSGRAPSANNLFYRKLYAFLFLAAAQLFAYSTYHKIKKTHFKRFSLDLCLTIFLSSVVIFGISISLRDYLHGEQILVFLTVILFVACLFMVKPYIAIIVIPFSFALFYYLMATNKGISNATRVNYPVILGFFILVNIAHYQQFLRIANHNVVNHALAEQLRNSSRYDFLTKLKNRTALNMDFENQDNPHLNSSFIVMLTDIDDFKIFNDTKGHHFGDELLKRLASIMQNNFGKTHCYRYGGDEYLVVLPEINEELFLEKIKIAKECLQDNLHFSGGYTKGYVSSSEDLHTLINKADEYLYKAKNTGKNLVLGSFE